MIALWCMAGMRRAGVQPDSWSFNTLMSACERCNEAERALEVFSMMEREARRTHGYVRPCLYTYNTLISGCGKAGMFLDVKRLYGDMLDRNIRGDVFTMCGIVTACEKVCYLWPSTPATSS